MPSRHHSRCISSSSCIRPNLSGANATHHPRSAAGTGPGRERGRKTDVSRATCGRRWEGRGHQTRQSATLNSLTLNLAMVFCNHRHLPPPKAVTDFRTRKYALLYRHLQQKRPALVLAQCKPKSKSLFSRRLVYASDHFFKKSA